MPFALACDAPPHQLAVIEELDGVVRALAALADRILEVTAEARGLVALTDWHARAAAAFHERAEEWAGEISSLYCPTETARILAADARDRVALAVWDDC
ncbi:hypothetical protein [Microbacterium immunditiarum]|uniref:Uncharacterized protein n=1 Tax=Microbacterium immunditiarum TaxID=337480 RepID=A0A7Y9GL25_9MICO|nr:hypothetical protein [Microbacterium immunditiarum]NYE18468.1 hypothetical protein [Microbacterium immunditiarum]